MRKNLLILSTLIFLFLSPVAYAQDVLNISLLVAFVGGMLMFLSPCSFSLVPAFFANSFQQKKKLLLATFVFFLGFALMFSLFGFTAAFVGYYLNLYKPEITFYLGLLLVLFGFLLLIGKGFPHLRIKKFDNSLTGTFLFGVVYSFGYAGCAGPILAGILLMAATLPAFNASLLMFAYALGLGIPLMTLSYFFDRIRIFDRKIFYRPVFNFRNKIVVTLPNLLSASLLFLIGYVYIRYRSIYPFNIGLPSLQDVSYSLQRNILQSTVTGGNIIFLLVLVVLMVVVFKLSKTNKISKVKLKRR